MVLAGVSEKYSHGGTGTIGKNAYGYCKIYI